MKNNYHQLNRIFKCKSSFDNLINQQLVNQCGHYVQIRFISCSKTLWMRGKKGSTTSGPSFNGALGKITGDFNAGLHRYEVDWFETAEWTKNLLESMKVDGPELMKKYSIRSTQFSEPSNETPFCFQRTESYTYDFSVPNSEIHPITLHVKVSDLGLSSAQEHKLKLLAGNMYDPHTDVVSIRRDNEGYSYNENMVILSDIMNILIEEAKDLKETFEDIPLDLRFVDKKVKGFEFPVEWIEAAKTKKQEKQYQDVTATKLSSVKSNFVNDSKATNSLVTENTSLPS